MNTLPTAILVEGTGTRIVTEVPTPDGLVLVREDCDTCGNTGVISNDEPIDGWMPGSLSRPCPTCLGAPLLAWYRVCDQCDGTGRRFVTIQTTIEPARREDFGPCRNCVEIDGRRLVKVRRNP